jgi:DNA-binding SARP family transcriptional activator
MGVHIVQTIGNVTIDGVPLTKSQRPLVSALAVARRDGATVDMLADAVWSGSLPRSARQSIQNQIGRLRHSFGAGLIETSGDRYRLRCVTDIDEVDRIAPLCGRRAITPCEAAGAAAILAGWTGEPYADLPDHPAAQAERARLQLVRSRLVEVLAIHHMTDPAGDPHLAIVDLTVRTATDPLHEQAWELLVVALHLVGRRTEALGTYAHFAEVLDQHIGAAPSRRFQQLRAMVEEDRSIDPASISSSGAVIEPFPLRATA